MRLLVISGLSGSGKSIALEALEDMDFYCVDNLPVGLLPEFAVQMINTWKGRNTRSVAVGIDARNVADELHCFKESLEDISKLGIFPEIIFLEANDNTLLKRFSETRRKHPLTSPDISLNEAIEKERKLLAPISALADLHIDTSYTNVHQLRTDVRERVAKRSIPSLSIQFVSFGFKEGIPADADFVFDVRCLPNPYWDPRLRLRSGRTSEVKTFLMQQPVVMQLYEDIRLFLERWIPHFEEENRSYMTVALGCTGGQHRSVFLADLLAEHFQDMGKDVLTRHRELT